MLSHSPSFSLRGTCVLFSVALFFLLFPLSGRAESLSPPCKGRGKDLVLCWKKMDPERARGDHDAWHKAQNALHLQWHQEHRNMTDAQVTVDHQKFHQDMARKHQEFHRSTKAQGDGEKKKVVTPANARDTKAAPNKGLSKKRQLRQGK
ncbi:hypothetical protein HYW84_03195 [Candidatus Peregrinibacteria bacterium]|nr:hypothetical protein [Candidatus Peregrinibacteria bacterium]